MAALATLDVLDARARAISKDRARARQQATALFGICCASFGFPGNWPLKDQTEYKTLLARHNVLTAKLKSTRATYDRTRAELDAAMAPHFGG